MVTVGSGPAGLAFAIRLKRLWSDHKPDHGQGCNALWHIIVSTCPRGASCVPAYLPSATGYSLAEEIASSITHGIGIVLSIAGLVLLVAWAAVYGGPLAVTTAGIFGTTLILVYTASTLYHAIPIPSAKRVLRVLDHVTIFLLIAGTYTPFTLLALPPIWGWSLFTLIWALALGGSAMEILSPGRSRRLAVALYVMMGWTAVVAIVPLTENLSAPGLTLLLAGGIAYTLGVPFYLLRRLRWHHSIWHTFVLAGSVLHYLAILLYVMPNAH